MSTLKAEALMREFHYNGIRIPDPGLKLSLRSTATSPARAGAMR